MSHRGKRGDRGGLRGCSLRRRLSPACASRGRGGGQRRHRPRRHAHAGALMTQFAYEARSGAGRLEKGSVEAPDRDAAIARLYQRNLTPLVLRTSRREDANIKLDDRAAHELARTLAQMLRAGLTFSQALKFASDELSAGA